MVNRCGNESTTGPYCSSACRNADSTRSPDFSPTTSTLPLLSSSKSICSTPPSSINNSPSPIEALMNDGVAGEEPIEPLDLSTALALKFDYNGASLPNGLRYPTYSLQDSNSQDISYPSKELSSTSLGYKRKPSNAPNQVPSPLYYRQAAAQANFSPSSPPKAPFSPRFSPARPPTISRSQMSAFALPPAIKSAPLPFTTSSIEFEPIVKKARASMSALADSRPNLLFSPRIRALRSEDAVVITEEKEELRDDELLEPEDKDSAFARYLFAQLAVKNSPTVAVEEREGRSIVGAVTGEKRSLSADSVFPSRNLSTTVRPTRFLFGRGTSAEGMGTTTENAPPFQPPLSPSHTTAENLTLTPGRFITATFDSISPSVQPSPLPSPPLSPPTFVQRGRSDNRRHDESSPSSLSLLSNSIQPSLPAMDPRGRSKLRTLTSVQRDLSPTRDSSNSSSRGRRSSTEREDIRMTSSSRARAEREEVSRGRGRRDSFDDQDEDEEEESARDGRGRSRSLARVGRGVATR